MTNALLTFSDLPLKAALLTNLDALGYHTMTPIQAAGLPRMLHHEDVIAQASTGSGKTAAFGLSLLNHLNLSCFAVQALVLCPTRELAEQTSQALRKLARLMPNVKIIQLSGGTPIKPQLDSLKHGAHIVVGTPGRIQKHLDTASLTLNQLTSLVLDEADRMLDMGFLDAIRTICQSCPEKRQTLLFSATYPPEINHIAQAFMHNACTIVIEQAPSEMSIEQRFYEVHPDKKCDLLIALLRHHQATSTLIFCNTKQHTTDLVRELNQKGFSAMALNGDMEQLDRELAIIQFTHQSCVILVATDVAARGLDIKELPLVINYDLAHEHDVHTHRIGRTGRAGHKGLAVSLTTPADAARICLFEDTQKHPIQWGMISELTQATAPPILPNISTLCLSLGKKDKIRASDILGLLTKKIHLPAHAIGKITIMPMKSFVAIHKQYVKQARQGLQQEQLKGRRIRVNTIETFK
jgi:ATP-dependent RNA helicase DbpA